MLFPREQKMGGYDFDQNTVKALALASGLSTFFNQFVMEVSLKIAAFFYISLYCTCLHMTVASVEFCVPSPRAHTLLHFDPGQNR